MSRSVYRFATFRLDVAARELHSGGKLLTVSPKVFDGLVWLIEHRERAVGRDELIAAIWGRVDVTDAQLGQLIRKLRRVVGDAGEGQSMVRTVPRFGYRWVAETRLADAGDAVVESPPPGRTPRRIAAAVAAAVLALAVVLGAWLWHARPALDAKDAVAVLPVAVEPEADPESAWLRLGLMDQIAERLREAGLRVVPSGNIAATARNDGTPLLGEQRVGAATGAGRFVVATTRRVAAGWVSRIEWRDADRVLREVEANGDSAVAATRQAGNRLLLALGRPAGTDVEQGDAPNEQWLQRIDAAVLDTDFTTARSLLDEAPADLRGTPAWLLRRADVDLATERMEAARAGYLELLGRLPAIDATTHARALIGLSGPVAQAGDLAAAQRSLGEAIGLLRGMNAPQLLGEAFYGRGLFRMVQGDLDDAEADFSQARIALELAGDSLQLARLQGQQATLLALRNRHAESLAMWNAAADRFERFGDAEKFVDALGNCATEQLYLLQPQGALATVRRAEPWLARLDHPLSEALFGFTFARVLALNGRTREAREKFQSLLGSAASAEIVGMPAAVQVELAQLDFEQGDAASAARRAEAAMRALADPALASTLYARIRNSGWLVLSRSLRATAAAKTETAPGRLDAPSNDAGIGAIYRNLVEAETRWPVDPAAATRAYEASLAAAKGAGAPADVAEVVVSWGMALIRAGQASKATTVVGQVADWAGEDFACAVLQARLYLALRQPEAFARAYAAAQRLAGERPLPGDLLAASTQLR
ncbi:winged helix-turn-helix domain-containing protein [Dokdonella ginsengisoli]|uniref:Winged helix-turn-helix domain-containing protein n=1 Tax=Dokdonella ginsengisoli TaxID=363846 RepID=A0ABV9QP60_9GAMM